MLHDFLKMIGAGGVQSLLEISRALRIPPAMAVQMADDLTRRGYLQEMGGDCGTSHAGCSDCSGGSTCQVSRNWFLTEKGKAALQTLQADR